MSCSQKLTGISSHFMAFRVGLENIIWRSHLSRPAVVRLTTGRRNLIFYSTAQRVRNASTTGADRTAFSPWQVGLFFIFNFFRVPPGNAEGLLLTLHLESLLRWCGGPYRVLGILAPSTNSDWPPARQAFRLSLL